MSGQPARVAILGAGPVGLESAARALEGGHDVTILERAEPGAHFLAWSHVRLFTPFGMNVGESGLALLTGSGRADDLPGPEDFLTAGQYRNRYLLPLARSVGEKATLLSGAEVFSVSRSTLLKNELPPRTVRAADPFRVLYRRSGEELDLSADVVIDCTGTYGSHNWLGSGGAPARGERAASGLIDYGLPDVLGSERPRFAGRRTLLVGGGHSAATTAVALAELAGLEVGTSFLWISRGGGGQPVTPVPGDPLPARAELTERANAVAAQPPTGSAWRPDGQVVALRSARGDSEAGSGEPEEGVEATIRFGASARPDADSAGGSLEDHRFDRVVANIGYEPDDAIYRQLQVHECYASRAPMKLSAALLGATAESADCLDVGGFGPEVLENPEPNFFILGIKSYGRNPAFLLRTGYEQVRDAFTLLVPTRGATV